MITKKSKTLSFSNELTRDNLRRAIAFAAAQGGNLLLGMLLAQTRFAEDVFFGAAPFAIALAAAGSIRYLGVQVLGIAVGSLWLLDHPANIAVMAAAAAAGLFNLAIRKLGLGRKRFVPFCAFACSAASGVICLLSPNKPIYVPSGALGWAYALCGAVLCGCSAYFIILAQAGLAGSSNQRTKKLHINRRERASLLLCCGMAITAFGGIQPGQLFRPSHIIAVLFILAAAYCWRESGGAIAGCCAGAALALAADEPSLTAVFALGGLLAGVFSNLHANPSKEKNTWKGTALQFLRNISTEHEFTAPPAFLTVPVAGGFALVCAFFLALHSRDNDPSGAVVFALECLLAIFIFLLIPVRAWNALRLRFAAPEEAALTPPETEAALQLSRTAGALRKVSEYVEEVSRGLEQLRLPPEQSVYAAAAQEICRACPEYDYCHKEHGDSSARLSALYLKRMRRYGVLSMEDLELARRECGITQPCRHGEALCRALQRAYDIHCAKKAGNHAETQLRRTATEQFDSLSLLLEEVGAGLARQKAFDAQTAESAMRVLEDHGFRPSGVVCAHGEEKAALLYARVLPEADHSSREELTSAIGRATGISFEPPSHTPAADSETLLTFCQRPLYALKTGAVQMSSSRSDYCGDYFDCFNDNNGREILIISDGMGTGGRAAVDSALATEIFSCLIRTGLSFEGAVRIANQALLLKSSEESLATLDAAGINLYTGEVEFCKAGGAASFLRRRGAASKVELSALPAGILRSIRPARFHAMLEPGDILVLVSDGMLGGAQDAGWIGAALEAFEGDDMQELAELLAGQAVRLRQQARGQDMREDDLTVICGKLDIR